MSSYFGGKKQSDDEQSDTDSEDFDQLKGNSRTGFMREDPNSEDGGMIEVKPQRLEITADGALEERLLIRREGWMQKKGGTVNRRGGASGGGRTNWKKRWFVLAEVPFRGQTGYELRYYDRPKGALKGSVGLSEVTIFCESTQKKGDKKFNLLKKFEFQLQLPNGGSLQLSCDQPDEREEWIETINIVVAYLRLLTHPELAMVINGYDPMNEEDEEVYKQGDEIAQNCQTYGPGLFGSEAGQQGQFVLEIHDIEGEPVTRGGMPVTCTIANDNLMYYVAVTDNENGTYSGFYTLSTPGKYKMHIRLNDEHDVFGSPYDIEILPSKTRASHSIAEGDCLTKVTPSEPCSFIIYACDSYGNKKTRGGDQFEVGIMGPAQLISLHDNLDGSYLCTFEAQDPTTLNYYAPSSLMIVITLHGKAISGSPFRPIILDAPPQSQQSAVNSISDRDRHSGSASYVDVDNMEHDRDNEIAMAAMSIEQKSNEETQLRPNTNANAENTYVDDGPIAPIKKEVEVAEDTKKASSRLERARQRANRAKAMLS
jgi:hypothetical protein